MGDFFLSIRGSNARFLGTYLGQHTNLGTATRLGTMYVFQCWENIIEAYIGIWDQIPSRGAVI